MPVDGSNNTGEMRAIIELFDYILHFSSLPHGSSVKICIDSSYVIRSLQGDQLPSTHHQLVELAQQYYTAIRTVYYVDLIKVPSHTGIPGNELVDSVAKRGVSSFGSVGCFSIRSPLNPPQLGYNSDIWLAKSPQEQSDFLCSLLLSKKYLIPTLPVSAKKPWITSATLDLISQFQDCTDLTVPEVKSLRKRIKKSASRDKKSFIAQHLQDDFHGSSIYQWRTARSIRKPFTPRSVNLYNIHGKLTSKDQRATTFAEYLSEKVWKAPTFLPDISETPSPTVDCSAPFTMSELNIVLRSLSTGRAPGPDSIPADMLKGSQYILKLFLLDHFNHCLSTSMVPDSWALSEVVMLVKKIQQDTPDLSNYRPISLTNTMYKIFASLIQKRLAHFLILKFVLPNLGFALTSQLVSLFTLCAVFLKFLKDNKTPYTFSFSIGLRHSIPLPLSVSLVYLRCLSTLYSLFTLPLSFVFATQAKPHKFSTRLGASVKVVVSQFGLLSGVINTPSPLWDLEYADDTALLSNSAEQITRLLHLLQREAHIRGLTLNFEKCAHLRLHSAERIYFSPSLGSPCQCRSCHGHDPPLEPVPRSDEVKYLGIFLDSSSNNRKNVSYRVSQAMTASKLLRPLLAHRSLPPSWKLTVYRSIIQSILLYAMERAQLTPPQLTKLNHVNFKSILRIFRIKSSFYHRVLNPSIEDCSNTYLASLSYDSSRVVTPSQIYSQNRLTLLGHLFRHPDSLEYSSTMNSGQYRFTRGPNRVGRPRLHWAESVMSEASNRISFLESDRAPSHSDIDNSFFHIPNASTVRHTHVSPSLMWMDNTTLYRRIQPRAQNRREWINIVHKPPKKKRQN